MESINKILDIVDDHKEEMKDCEYKTIMDNLMKLKQETDKIKHDSDSDSDVTHTDSSDSDDDGTGPFYDRPSSPDESRQPRTNIHIENNIFVITEDVHDDPRTFIVELVPGNYTKEGLLMRLEEGLNQNTTKNNKYSINTRYASGSLNNYIKITVSGGTGVVKIEDVINRPPIHGASIYSGMIYRNTLNQVLGICPNTYIIQDETHIGFRQYNLG